MPQSVSSTVGRAAFALVFPAFMVACVAPAIAAEAKPAASCAQVVARVVSVQGAVELRHAGEQQWAAVARLDTPVCRGDELRTGARSRAAIVIPPEKFVRLDQNSTVTITLTEQETVLELIQDDKSQKNACGGAYLITRFPRSFKVRTRYLNAAVEGTEFSVGLSCAATTVSVFEGKVRTEAPQSSAQPILITSGQSVLAAEGEPPVLKVTVKPVDAVQWALYYPPLSATRATVDQDCSLPAPEQTVPCLIARAEERLRVGRLDDAQADIEAILALRPESAEAQALLAVIAIAKNEKQRALELAQNATRIDPGSARAWIALSYAQQAAFKLEDALAAAQRAAELAPRSSTAQARLAELLMSLGRIRSAERAARAAVEADRNESRAHTILGFAHLAQIDTRGARDDFQAAIERDSADPLPRLGLGLAIIRQGNLVAGREQIEIAVALDPTNSLLRSYVGKAYYEESTKARDKLAGTQFGLAKQLDPKDPTPWFYDAILKDSQNRPVEALIDLEQSKALNDNRATYRSRLLLDEDQAARAASLGRVYQDLGFDQLATSEAASSLSQDPSDYTAHRLLADSYSAAPRREIARESELLMSSLLQPSAISPVSPLRPLGSASFGPPKVGVLSGLGPAQAGLNEFNPLFARNGANLYLDALAGENDTLGQQMIVTGMRDSLSFSAAEARFRTDEFRPNRDFAQDGYSALIQENVDDRTSFQTELRAARFDGGDVPFAFDPTVASPLRKQDSTQTFRLGAKHTLAPGSEFLISLSHEEEELDFQSLLFNANSKFLQNATSGEVQYLKNGSLVSFVAGAGATNSNLSSEFFFAGTSLGPPDEASSNGANAYLYSQIVPPGTGLKLLIGLSADYLDNGDLLRSELNPKLGLSWTPLLGTTFRAAAFRSMKRQLIDNQTLEPTQFDGFVQFFDDLDGTIAWQYALGVDQRISKSLFVGAEATSRDLLTPAADPTTGTLRDFRWKEDAARAYAYWAIPANNHSNSLVPWPSSLSIEYQYEHFQRPEAYAGVEGFVELVDHFVPVTLATYPATYLSLRIRATYVRQTGQLQAGPASFGFQSFDVDNRFWVSDLGVDYRLPGRAGQITVAVSNLFGQNLLDFQDTDPANPRFARGRFAYARLTLLF